MPKTHTAVAGSIRRALPGSRVLGRANKHSIIEVTVKVNRKAAVPELSKRPTTIMTRDAVTAAYGAEQSVLDKVSGALGKFGLKTVSADSATRSIRLQGTVSDMENAFQVKLFNYTHEGGAYRGRVGSVHVPVDIADQVAGVFGLDNRRIARRRRQPIRDETLARALTSVPAAWYTPAELASHYNFPPGDGTGQTVGILEFGGGYFEKDLAHFCKLADIKQAKVTALSTDGTSTSAKDGAEGEVMLDVEVVAGVCPGAAIVLYFSDFSDQGWLTALDAVRKDSANDPGVVSVSWGYAEDNDIWTDQAMTQVNESFQELALMGITVCIAAGDDGSSDAISDGQAHVDFPGSSPFVVSVGGTTIPSKTGGASDIGWKEGDGLRSDNGGSTGGGVSSIFPRPSWQSAITIESVNPGAISGRVVPDVSANADWTASPYLLVVDGKAQPNGGTSAATPLFASLITRINQRRGAGKRVGYITPVLYGPSGTSTIGGETCTDIVSGNNVTDKIGGYTAGPGYDAVSGWGTPNGLQMDLKL